MLAPEFKQNTDYGQPEIVFETHLNLSQQTHYGSNIFFLSSVDQEVIEKVEQED